MKRKAIANLLVFLTISLLLGSSRLGGTVAAQEPKSGDLPTRAKFEIRDSYAAKFLAFSPDGKTLLLVHSSIALFDVQARKWTRTLKRNAPLAIVTAVAFSPDGKTLAAGHFDGSTQLWDWDAEAPKPRRTLKFDASADAVHGLAFSPDGKTLAIAFFGTTELWDVAAGKLRGRIDYRGEKAKPDKNWATGPEITIAGGVVAFSPDGKTLATGGGARYAPEGRNTVENEHAFVHLWDAHTGKRRATLEHKGHSFIAYEGASVAFSPDGRRVMVFVPVALSPEAAAFVGSGRSPEVAMVVMWDVKTGKELAVIECGTFVRSVSWRADGRIFATVGKQEVRLWDLQTQKERAVLKVSNSRYPRSVAFSPDGKTLASAHLNHLYVWETPGK